ncbi:TetR family transcriptional regulator [Actinomadura rayongensis]|uniref:TetR family transcriptional regulator n=1 Tax=Actinomadura rayongensis TaxID=1429076 RepID=A0A6I4W9E9_9ACTN|nr:TetR family transcriptional regulator [Actinomadura rayongensis]
MPSQAERSAASRRELMDAAIALFAERGYHATSVADIGAHAGQSRAAVNFHFGSKEALLLAIVRHVVEEWEEHMLLPELERAATSPEALTDAGFGAHRRLLAEQPMMFALHHHLMAEAIGPNPAVRDAFAALNRRVRGRIAELVGLAKAAGTVPDDVDPDGLAGWLLGALRGIAQQHLVDPDLDLDAAYGELRRAVLARVRR